MRTICQQDFEESLSSSLSIILSWRNPDLNQERSELSKQI